MPKPKVKTQTTKVAAKNEQPYLTDSMKKSEVDKINKSFSENSIKVMEKRYLIERSNGKKETPADMFARIAGTLARVEKNYGKTTAAVKKHEREFFDLLSKKKYTPAGRTVRNVGAQTSLVANCIVLPVGDSMEEIFQTLKDASLLQQAGSGLGFDFSFLRPAMTPTKKSQGVSSGPVEFLKVYDAAFGVIKQQKRHGANMGMMSVEHPDVLDFIRAKEVEGSIRNFNISVQLTDRFIKAVKEKPNEQWYCVWKDKKLKPRRVLRTPNGSVVGVEEVDVTAKEIFDELVEYAWQNGEPGVFFVDEVNRKSNPLPGLGAITCTNPCGEQPLHPYDNCNLGSINLAQFVSNKKVNWADLKKSTKLAVRMQDNVIDLFDFPVEKVTALAQKNRRIGLGVMGFADMLYQMRVPYNSEKGVKLAEKVMETISTAAHEMSRELAKEKGEFPNIEESVYGKKYAHLRKGEGKGKKKKVSMRNSALTTIAPTGAISMMLDCSGGIEPEFALAFVKQDKDGIQYHYLNTHFENALRENKVSKAKIEKIKAEIKEKGSIQHMDGLPKEIKETFVVSMDISAKDHMKMQAAFQKHVDNSISKTINFPNSATREDIAEGFINAWEMGCLSATVYRDGSREVQILNLGDGKDIKKPTEIGGKKETLPVAKMASDTNGHQPKDRPEVMSGKTYRRRTGYGNLFVTVNNDENGRPFEVFATIGKSGGFFQEQSEAMCRMISTALRAGVSIKEIISQLKGIRGPMPTMTEKGTILSLPDAIGQVMEEHIGLNKTHDLSLFDIEPTPTAVLASSATTSVEEANKSVADFGHMPGCPDCGSALKMAEGCISCSNPACGFSRCT